MPLNQKLTDKPLKDSFSNKALVHIVEPEDYTQGDEGSDYKMLAKDFQAQAGQDNIDIRKFISIDDDDTITDIVTKINALPNYTVNEKQSVWFIASEQLSTRTLGRVMKFKMMNKGKGNYGVGGTQLSNTDIELVYDNTATILDIENDPTTDTFDYGDLTGETISEWLNGQDPALVIQSQEDGYTIFKGSVDGIDTTYLWIGEPGVYGVGESASTMADFEVLSDEIAESPAQILPWEDKLYNENEYVSKEINSQLYLFRSTENDNTTEPFLNGNYNAWTQKAGVYVGEWSAGSYVVGNVVSKGTLVYYCQINTSTDPTLLSTLDWVEYGLWEETFNPANTYLQRDVVIDGSNNVYVSNFNNNTYPLNNGIVSKWELVNGQPQCIVIHGNSLSAGTGATEKGNYPKQINLATGINVDVNAVPGATLDDIQADFMAQPEKWEFPTIFWAIENNRFDSASSIKAKLDAMITRLPHDRYLVIGTLHATYDGTYDWIGLNNDLAAYYGDRYIPMYDYLYNLYGNVDGTINAALRSDGLHLNDAGYFQASKAILSKINILLGEEYTYSKNLQANAIRVTGNTLPVGNIESLEFIYDKATGKGLIQATDRSGAVPVIKDLQIGQPSGDTTILGNLFLDNVSSGRIPYEGGSGVVDSPIYSDGTNVGVGIASPEVKFHVLGIGQFGDTDLRVRVGKISPTKGFIQFFDGSVGQNGQIFTKQLQVGLGSVTPTTDGEIAVFDGEVKVADATLNTSAVNLGQLEAELGDYIIKTGETSQTFEGNLTTRGIFESFQISGAKTQLKAQGVGFTEVGGAFEGLLGGNFDLTANREWLLPDANGTVALKEYVDARSIVNTTSTPFTLSTINSTYPSAQNGDRIVCPNVNTGTIYTKAGSAWVVTSGVLLT